MKNNISFSLKSFIKQYSIASLLVLITIFLCLIDSTLLSVRNVRNILSDAAPIVLMAAGMALCLYSSFVDLSAGALAGFAGLLAGVFVQRNDAAGKIIPFLPPIPAIIVIPLTIALFYFIGTLYARFLYRKRIPSWIFTLAMSSIIMGFAYMLTSTTVVGVSQVTGFANQFLQFGVGYIGNGPTYSIPITVIVTILTLIALVSYLRYRNLGLRGKVENLHERNTEANIKIIFGCSTALFALAGIMIAARNGIASPAIGFGLTSDALAICLMAKFTLKGGHGNIRSIIITSIIYVMLVYCVTYIGVSEYISLVIRGVILVFAFMLDSSLTNKKQVVQNNTPD